MNLKRSPSLSLPIDLAPGKDPNPLSTTTLPNPLYKMVFNTAYSTSSTMFKLCIKYRMSKLTLYKKFNLNICIIMYKSVNLKLYCVFIKPKHINLAYRYTKPNVLSIHVLITLFTNYCVNYKQLHNKCVSHTIMITKSTFLPQLLYNPM